MSDVVIPEVMARELAIVDDRTLANTLADKFSALFADAEKWSKQASSIVVSDASEMAKIKAARELRLNIRRVRCDAENRRKELKAGIVQQGRAIDGMGNIIKALCEPAEAHLQAQEDFAARMEAERKQKLAHDRASEISQYVSDVTPYSLGEMTSEAYSVLLSGLKFAHNQKLEADRVAKEQAEAKAKAEAEERERVRVENERLRREIEIAEAKAKAERDAMIAEQRKRDEVARKEREIAEAKAKAERDAREKAELELAAQRKREEAERARIAEEAKKKAAAPDKEKLNALAEAVRSIPIPSFSTNDGIEAGAKAKAYIDRLAIAIEEIAKSL